MALKLMASVIGAAVMVTSVVAQDFPDDSPVQMNMPVAMVRGSCDRAARQAVASTGGELLSVQPARNGKPVCAVTVLVTNAKGRPKKVRLRLPMD